MMTEIVVSGKLYSSTVALQNCKEKGAVHFSELSKNEDPELSRWFSQTLILQFTSKHFSLQQKELSGLGSAWIQRWTLCFRRSPRVFVREAQT